MVPQALPTPAPQNVGSGMDIFADQMPPHAVGQNGGMGGGPELYDCPST